MNTTDTILVIVQEHERATRAFADTLALVNEQLARRIAEDADREARDAKRHLVSNDAALALIAGVVCEAFGIPLEQLRARRRSLENAIRRCTFCALASEFTNASLPQIAKAAGYKDHTSALEAAPRLKQYCETRPHLAHLVANLQERCQTEFEVPSVRKVALRHLRAVS
jgi:chromosomal replication initiator protein